VAKRGPHEFIRASRAHLDSTCAPKEPRSARCQGRAQPPHHRSRSSCSSDLLPPSPPAEKATARQNQAGVAFSRARLRAVAVTITPPGAALEEDSDRRARMTCSVPERAGRAFFGASGAPAGRWGGGSVLRTDIRVFSSIESRARKKAPSGHAPPRKRIFLYRKIRPL
jgi:hypothetical protein